MKKLLIVILSLALLTACSKEDSQQANTGHAHESEKYTCPMHPQVVQDKPGSCPVCGMDLVKVAKSDTSGASGNDLMLTDSQIKLANITTEKVSKRSIGQSVVINGSLAVDEQQSEVISSRVAGRVEKLFVKETGQFIRKGQPLYTLYSEQLLTLQQEYLLAKEQYEALGRSETRYRSFLDAAEKKLLLYGLTQSQVDQLTSRTSSRPLVTIVAPASGVVTEINVSEGQSVPEGGSLYKIEDVSRLWVEAELYPGEASLFKVGDRINVRAEGSSETIAARVTFMSPEYRSNSQVTILRASVNNPNLKLKPGQQVQVYLTHSAKAAIAVPVDAVIRDGRGAHLYVQAGRNTFRPVMVKTGIESFDQVEITRGLNEGDTVAVSGAYLLYSELILKKGTDPMAGHNHD